MDLDQRLQQWVGEGLISPDQATAIRAHEQVAAADDRPDRRSSLAEAVGYLGAALTIVAGALVLSEFWDQITPWGRLVLTGLLTVVVFAAGWVLRGRDHPAVQRLVSVLWFSACIGVAFTVGMATDQAGRADHEIGLGAAVAVAVVAAALHRLRQTPLQLIALVVGIAAVALTALAFPRASVDSLYYGLLLYGVGVAVLLLSTDGWLRPRRTGQVLGLLAIGIGCQVGAFESHTGVAVLLALVTAGALTWYATTSGDTVVLAFAAAGVFVFTPQAVFEFFGDAIGAPFALLLTGLLLVAGAVALVTVRRQVTEGSDPAAPGERS